MMRRSSLQRKTPLRSRVALRRGSGLRPVSKRRRSEQREYTNLRVAFLQGRPWCEFPGCIKPATDIHHKRGRTGSLYLDVDWWMPLCRQCHQYATEHPADAIALGVSHPRIGEPS